jgi:putative transposase
MGRISFETDEYYHIYNRGTDKRDIFSGGFDYFRFIRSLKEFNQVEPIVSLYIKDQLEKAGKTVVVGPLHDEKLVEIVAFNLLPNHFHLILKQSRDGGVSEFMKRVSGGYTRYFNYKYKRSGSLFQGKFKATHINSNEKLLYLSAYVNGNHKVHGSRKKNKFSSMQEYLTGKSILCNPKIIIDQFKTVKDYEEYAENTVKEINEVREDIKKDKME